jgi:hypothetical protein
MRTDLLEGNACEKNGAEKLGTQIKSLVSIGESQAFCASEKLSEYQK